MKKGLIALVVTIFAVTLGAGCSQPNIHIGNYSQSPANSDVIRRENVPDSNSTKVQQDVYESVKTKPVRPIVPQGGTVQKKVYLTFDDGPDPINTPLVLNILETYGVKATFFVVGTNIEKNKGILKTTAKQGNGIGNHTYNHKYNEIYVGPTAFINSIKQNEELIFKLIGQRPKIVREPGGSVRHELISEAVAKSGYKLYDWNVDSYDSRTPEPDAAKIVENVTLQAANRKLWPNMVILLHDGHGHINSVRALPTIIEMLQSQGFEFEVLE